MPASSHSKVRRPLVIISVGIVVVVLAAWLVTRLGAGPGQTDGAASATAHDGHATTVSNQTAQVSLPDGAVGDGTRIQLSSTTLTDPRLDSITPLSDSVHVDTGTTTLTGGATVTFPAPAKLGRDIAPVVVWQDGSGGWEWVPTTWEPGSATVVANVTHFSFGFLGGFDVNALAQRTATNLKNYATGRSGAARPSCGKSSSTHDGDVQVRASGGDRVFWCLGERDGARILKVVNNTRAFAEVSYPSSWKVLDGLSLSLDADAMARYFGSKVHQPAKTSARIVDGGDTLTLQVPEGGVGRVVVQMSIVAWAVSAAVFGGETLFAVAGTAGGSLSAAARGRLDRLALFSGLGTSKEEAAEAPKECVKATSDLTGDLDAGTAQALAKFSLSCGSKLAAGLILGGGVKTYALGALVNMAVTTVGLVLTAVNLLVTGTREVWDAVASFSGRSDNVFKIVLSRAPQTFDYIEPGKLGPLKVGMDADDAVSLGLLKRHTAGGCPLKWRDTDKLTSHNIATEWRYDDPDKLDEIAVLDGGYYGTADKPTTRTRAGAEVGTSITKLLDIYGPALHKADWDGEGGPYTAYVLFGPDGALAFHVGQPGEDNSREVVTAMVAMAGTSMSDISPAPGGC